MIKSIRLLNWRSHADSFLEFRKGTNLLVGIMGAGKSSVLEGISFALFGTFPALERRKLRLENIVRLNEPHARVVLEFAWGGSAYRVERAIERTKKGTSSHAELFRDDRLIEHGPLAVTSYLKSLTSVDYDLFTRAIYSEQNNIDHFLNLDPRRRKEEMDALLGLDKFETARANAVTVIHRVGVRKDALAVRFSESRLRELEEKEKAAREDAARLGGELASLKERLLAKSSELEAAEAAFATMKAAKARWDSLSREEMSLAARVQSLSKDLEGRETEQARLPALEEKLASLLSERAKAESGMKSQEGAAASLSKEIGAIDARLRAAMDAATKHAKAKEEMARILGGGSGESLVRAQKECEGALLSLESERKAAERELSELTSGIDRLSPGMSSCPLCLAPLTDEGIAHVRKEKEGLIAGKKSRLSGICAALPAKRKENEDLLQRIRGFNVLGERVSALEAEAAAGKGLDSRRKELEESLSGVGRERASLREKLDALIREAESLRASIRELQALSGKKKELETAAGRLSAVRAELKSLGFDEKPYEELRGRAEAARLDRERLAAAVSGAEGQLRARTEIAEMAGRELAEMRGMAEEIRSLEALGEQLSIYKNALLDTQTSLRLNLAEAINTAMNEVWSIFYPYRNYHALRLGASEKDYLFEVDDGGGWRSLESVASGGERACAALALRVALAMVLTPRLGWLILDEPTHNLDAEAVEMLSGALQFKVPEVVAQTFVITHDEAFMGSDFASSYRLARDKDRNGETKVEAM